MPLMRTVITACTNTLTYAMDSLSTGAIVLTCMAIFQEPFLDTSGPVIMKGRSLTAWLIRPSW